MFPFLQFWNMDERSSPLLPSSSHQYQVLCIFVEITNYELRTKLLKILKANLFAVIKSDPLVIIVIKIVEFENSLNMFSNKSCHTICDLLTHYLTSGGYLKVQIPYG